jgi:hypothetical protein
MITAVLNMEVLILNPSMVAFSSSTVALGKLDPLAMGLISTCNFLSGSSSVDDNKQLISLKVQQSGKFSCFYKCKKKQNKQINSITRISVGT